jgi:hypothetical protein
MGIETKTQANEMSPLRTGVRTLATAFCINISLGATKSNRASLDLRTKVRFQTLTYFSAAFLFKTIRSFPNPPIGMVEYAHPVRLSRKKYRFDLVGHSGNWEIEIADRSSISFPEGSYNVVSYRYKTTFRRRDSYKSVLEEEASLVTVQAIP